MERQKHLDAPDTPGWHLRRARSFNAGDASAMLGCHPSGKTRTQLLQELYTGLQREFSDYVQERVLAPGHRIEALWRPIAEEILGEELQVLAGSLDVGLSRPVGASLDGITFMEDVVGECKSANEALRAALPHSGRDSHARNDARHLPKGYRVQIEQQQLVTGATRTLFSACLFGAGGHPVEERHCWYTSDPALRAEILAGWRQLDADLAAYVPAEAAAPKPMGVVRQALPALVIEATGEITTSNLDAYKVQALAEIQGIPVPEKAATDQQYADAKEDGKFCRGIQEAAEQGAKYLLGRMGSVDEAIKVLEHIGETARRKAIDIENAVAAEEKRRKDKLQTDAVATLRSHIEALNRDTGRDYLAMPGDFPSALAAAVKSKRNLESMEDAVTTTLATAKSAANERAVAIQSNLRALAGVADKAFLFADERNLVMKAPEDCRAVITARLAEHERKEAARLESERVRIRQEEEAKAQAKVRAEQAEREEVERKRVAAAEAEERRQKAEAEAERRRAAQATMTHPNGAPMFGQHVKENGDRLMLDDQGRRSVFCDVDEGDAYLPPSQAAVSPPAPAVIPMPTRAPAAPAQPTLRLGEIQKRIAPVSIDAAGLAAMGYPYAKQEGAAKLWHESDWPTILAALIQHLTKAQQLAKAA